MNLPLISVVIPVYNTAPYLAKCLESVVNQTYQNLQIIIINDGSTDGSAQVYEKFAKEDARIEFVNKENEGVSNARNIGINLAEGDWIYFLDSDDFLDLNAFEYLINIAISTKTDVIQFGARLIQDGKVANKKSPTKTETYDNLKLFLDKNHIKPYSMWLHFMRLELILTNQIRCNEALKHYEDGLFMYNFFAHAKKIMTIENIFYNQVLSPNSTSRSPINAKVVYDSLELVSQMCILARQHNKINDLKEEINILTKHIFMNIAYLKERSEYQANINHFQKTYRQIYYKNKDIFYEPYLKIALLDLRLVAYSIKINHFLRGLS